MEVSDLMKNMMKNTQWLQQQQLEQQETKLNWILQPNS